MQAVYHQAAAVSRCRCPQCSRTPLVQNVQELQAIQTWKSQFPSAGMQATIRSLQLDERMIALAAAISIDYDYFSQHSHGHGLLGPMMFPGDPLPAYTIPVCQAFCVECAAVSPLQASSTNWALCKSATVAHSCCVCTPGCFCAGQTSFACSVADGMECPAPGTDAELSQGQYTAAASWSDGACAHTQVAAYFCWGPSSFASLC